MDKQRQLEKLRILKENPDLSLFDQMEALNGKLRTIEDALKTIESKEVKTYEEELSALIGEIQTLQEALNGKDMVVNIPLDALSDKMVCVEQAIKAIKEVKIPEYKNFPLPDAQINELLFSIQSIPDFPIKELEKMITGLGKKIEAIKIDIPEREEFDYDRLEKEFSKLTKAVRGISISVSGGGGIGENTYFTGVKQINDNIPKGQQDQAESIAIGFAKDFYDRASRSLATIRVEHSAIHKGWHFTIADFALDVNATYVKRFTFTTPDTLKRTHFLFDSFSSKGMTVSFYEGSAVTGGTAVTPVQNQRNIPNTTVMTILVDPTITNAGTKLVGHIAGGGKQAGGNERENEFVLKQNTTYLVEYSSNYVANDIGWEFQWYEYEHYIDN